MKLVLYIILFAVMMVLWKTHNFIGLAMISSIPISILLLLLLQKFKPKTKRNESN